MALATGTKNSMLDHMASLVGFVSLHSADPGTTGANEISGGTPAYARKAVSWAAAAASSVASSADLLFDVPGGSTQIGYVGYWTAATGGTYRGSRPLDTPQTYVTQGTYRVAAGALTEALA